MSVLVWRLYRAQAAIAAGLLAAFAVLLLVTGLSMASQWHSVLAACTPTGTCGRSAQEVYLGSPAVQVLVVLTMTLPAVLGPLWGVPLVAHEIETGTRTFAWTQAVTRLRWLTAKVGWTLLASAVFGGAIAALVTWWLGPRNALYADAFDPGTFDLQGIAPVGYALFGTALGIATGTLLQRTVPALGITLGGFIAVRFGVNEFVRQHYMGAITVYHSPLAPVNLPGSAWILARGVIDKYGHVFGGGSGPRVEGVPISALPPSCQSLMFSGPLSVTKSHLREAVSCLQSQGFRGFTTYQPADRFWTFQGIETGIFVALALAALTVTYVVITRRDA